MYQDNLPKPENIFHFLNIDGFGEAGPGPSTMLNQTCQTQSQALNEDDDQRVEDVDRTAGKVFGKDQKLYDKMKTDFGAGACWRKL